VSRATSTIRVFAVSLITHEAKDRRSAGSGLPPAFRVCEKLRAPLATLMGHAGFHALLARALALASAEVPWLRTVRVRTDGRLEGLGRLKAPLHPNKFLTGSAVLVAELLGLLVAFIGEKLTLQLVREIWPKLPATPFPQGQGPTK
jgi:hypothetical protein